MCGFGCNFEKLLRQAAHTVRQATKISDTLEIYPCPTAQSELVWAVNRASEVDNRPNHEIQSVPSKSGLNRAKIAQCTPGFTSSRYIQ